LSDTGTGIAAEELPRLFDRFYRIEGSHGRAYEGSDIGLALARDLVKLHCGAIWADSVVGRGSNFHVTIPLGTDHLPANNVVAKPTFASSTKMADAFVEEVLRWLPADGDGTVPSALAATGIPVGDDRRWRILLADDNADMRILASAACDIEAVGDGNAALGAARGPVPPDLVLSAVMMPELDGIGLVHALRADRRTQGIPVILLSPRAGDEARVEGLSSGADDCMVKPFSARELLARVEGTLRLAKARREAADAERRLVERAPKSLGTKLSENGDITLHPVDLLANRRIRRGIGCAPANRAKRQLHTLLHIR